jgi:RNA polymerase sigma factor (sigma-70 family)
VEASTLQAPAGLARKRIAIGPPLLRLRSDEQLVALFRAGHDEAFRVIHDRYEKRLLAYTRQMLPRDHDAEDALQDVFVRAYAGLRTSDRELALRAWLFRVAHNRCIDELRRPTPPAPEVLQLYVRAIQDPVAEADRRESLRRLIVDVGRLPDQQRSALLMREMGGMSYAELAETLGTSVPAVKSLLVRARIALTQAATARDTACSVIREELVGSRDRGVRPNANAKRHMRDCAGCRRFRRELRAVNRRLAALAPLGPIALLAKTLGFSSGAGAGSGATATGGATASGGAAALGGGGGGGAVAGGGALASTGAIASGAVVVGTGHVATLLAAAVATAGGAVAISAPASHPATARPAALIRGYGASGTTSDGSATGAASQAGAAAAAGAALLDQSKASAASQATKAKLKTKDTGLPPAPTSSAAAPAGSSAATGSADGTGLASSSAGPTTGALSGASTQVTSGATSTGTGATTTSSGNGSGTAPGTSSGGSQPSGSSPSSSPTGTGTPGTTSNTTNSGTGSSSAPTQTASDTRTGTSSSSSSTGTSTSTQ